MGSGVLGRVSVTSRKCKECSLKLPLPAVQMAPPTLNLTKDREGYILHWKEEKMNYPHIGYIFQVQYKKDADSWEVRSDARGGA